MSLLWLLLLPPLLWLALLLGFGRAARAAWREPVWRWPVLIVESDDWGPGPPHHAQALRQLAALLARHRDATGRPALMSLALTLTLPDSVALAANQLAQYRARGLDDAAHAELLAALRAGQAAGVFALQLHGLAHYWPDALLTAARRDAALRAWLLAGPGQETEALPSALQSRWVDASVLPSRPLPAARIEAAAAEEVAAWSALFGAPPEVAVPPTFVWNAAVEAAWAAHGVAGVITPGHRCTGRDAAGQPQRAAGLLHNGARGAGGVTYLVRDCYFEPARGHRAAEALADLARKTAQGRPCLLETHRCNFTGASRAAALAELDALLAGALRRWPTLRFVSPAELVRLCRPGNVDHAALHTAWRPRLAAWQARMRAVPRFARLARLTGLALVLPGLRAGRDGGAA